MKKEFTIEQIKDRLLKSGFANITQQEGGFGFFYFPLISHCHFSGFVDYDGNLKELKDETDIKRIAAAILLVFLMFILIGCAPGVLGIVIIAWAVREYHKGEIRKKIGAIFEDSNLA